MPAYFVRNVSLQTFYELMSTENDNHILGYLYLYHSLRETDAVLILEYIVDIYMVFGTCSYYICITMYMLLVMTMLTTVDDPHLHFHAYGCLCLLCTGQ